METGRLRLAVATRAIGLLPRTLGVTEPATLCAPKPPRIIRERTCAFELLLAVGMVGVLVGWMLRHTR
tara:strand:- start:410 stop:613 length:204 start_codon:yes stop_codon:yes gene_type:complete